MNKRLYALVALGAVTLSVVGVSAFAGGAVTSRLSAQTAALAKLLPGLKVQEQIQRGVFSTTRTVTLRLGCAPLPGAGGSIGRTPPLELRWRDEIRHGPVPGGQGLGLAVIDSQLILPEPLAKHAKEIFGDKPPLALHTRIGFGGSFESDVSVPSVKIKPQGADELRFSGLTGRMTGRFPVAKGTLSYNWSEAPFSLSTITPDVTLKLELGALDATGSLQIDPDKPSLFVPFQAEASIDAMKLSTSTPSPSGGAPVAFELAFTKVKAKSQSKLEQELFTTTSSMVGALNVNGFVVDKFEIGSALRRLHAPTYAKLVSELIDLGLSCDKKGVDPTRALEALSVTAFALLPHDPEYAVGPLAIELAGKRAELSYSIGTRGVTPNDRSLPMLALLMQKSVARAEATAHLGLIEEVAKIASKTLAAAGTATQQTPPGTPDPFAVMARGMVDEFVKQGYLVREGDTVRGVVESAAGAIKLNGKPFALPDLGLGGP